MKKYVLPILTVILCLGATNTFAQIQKNRETPKAQQIVNFLQQKLNRAIMKKAAEQSQQPYYLTKKAEQTCEQYPLCKKQIEKMYQKDASFQVISITTWEYEVYRIISKKTALKTELSIHYRTKSGTNRFKLVVAVDKKPIPADSPSVYNY